MRWKIKRNIVGCVERLDLVVVSGVEILLGDLVQAHVNQRRFPEIPQDPIVQLPPTDDEIVGAPDRESAEHIPQNEGAGSEPASPVTEVGHDQVLSLCSRMWVIMWMVDVQDTQPDEQLSHPPVEREGQAGQPIEPSEKPPVKRLNGRVTRKEELPFAIGVYFEVWVGLLDEGGGEWVGREKADAEKVGVNLTTSTLLTLLFL